VLPNPVRLASTPRPNTPPLDLPVLPMAGPSSSSLASGGGRAGLRHRRRQSRNAGWRLPTRSNVARDSIHHFQISVASL
jgi:hypothetical protein